MNTFYLRSSVSLIESGAEENVIRFPFGFAFFGFDLSPSGGDSHDFLLGVVGETFPLLEVSKKTVFTHEWWLCDDRDKVMTVVTVTVNSSSDDSGDNW